MSHEHISFCSSGSRIFCICAKDIFKETCYSKLQSLEIFPFISTYLPNINCKLTCKTFSSFSYLCNNIKNKIYQYLYIMTLNPL